MSEMRVSQKQLEELSWQLSGRDKAILSSVQMCRLITSHQIQRIHIIEHESPMAATRATNRALAKFQDRGLIDTLSRKVGGERAGSTAYVWKLTELGGRLLDMENVGRSQRNRWFEPSEAFLAHTLEIAETYVRITEICDKYIMFLVDVEFEPECWRGYTSGGYKEALKPDMLVSIINWKYEYSYYLEIDRNTEAPSVVLEKCKKYAEYYITGAEQQATGVYPLVVWLVPDSARRDSLKRHIANCSDLLPKHIFLVITIDELEAHLIFSADVLYGEELEDMMPDKRKNSKSPLPKGVRVVPEFRKEVDTEKLARALVAVSEKTPKRQAA